MDGDYLADGKFIKESKIDISGGKRFEIPDEEKKSLRLHMKRMAKTTGNEFGSTPITAKVLWLLSALSGIGALLMKSRAGRIIFFSLTGVGIIFAIIFEAKNRSFADNIDKGALEYYEFTVDKIFSEPFEGGIITGTKYYAKFNGIIMYLGTLDPSMESGSTIALVIVRCKDRICVAHTREIPNKTPYINGRQDGEGQWNLKK